MYWTIDEVLPDGTVRMTEHCDVEFFRREIARIPPVTEAQAKALAAQLDRAIRHATRRVRAAAAEALDRPGVHGRMPNMLLLLALLAGCTPTADSFPREFAVQAYRIETLNGDPAIRYEANALNTCDGTLLDAGVDLEPEYDRGEIVSAAEALMDPCEFDADAAAACLAELRAVRTCDDALAMYRDAYYDGESWGEAGDYLFVDCRDACGVGPAGEDSSP
jgi:hypothetical protein